MYHPAPETSEMIGDREAHFVFRQPNPVRPATRQQRACRTAHRLLEGVVIGHRQLRFGIKLIGGPHGRMMLHHRRREDVERHVSRGNRVVAVIVARPNRPTR